MSGSRSEGAARAKGEELTNRISEAGRPVPPAECGMHGYGDIRKKKILGLVLLLVLECVAIPVLYFNSTQVQSRALWPSRASILANCDAYQS